MSRRLLDGRQPVAGPGTNHGGKPGYLDTRPHIPDRTIAAIRIGVPLPEAFMLEDVDMSTLRKWILKGNEKPKSKYGALVRDLKKLIAEYQFMDVSIIQRHAMGAPAEYEMEPVVDPTGKPVLDPNTGLVLMKLARDPDGKAVLKRPAIQSDWKAALERLQRRVPRYWSKHDTVAIDGVLKVEVQDKPESTERLPFDERIAIANRKLEDDV